MRELTQAGDLIPKEDSYQFIIDGDEAQIIQGIEQLKQDLAQHRKDLLQAGDLRAVRFNQHLFQPLFHVRRGGKITFLPVSLNESEFQFVTDLGKWCGLHQARLEKDGPELFLLRNMIRGKGVGFFEAGNFHPDCVLWLLTPDRQYLTFIEPHGLLHEGPASEKVLFHQRIKDVERRLNDPAVTLNSFILSWTRHPQLNWGKDRDELEALHILFMTEDADRYIDKIFAKLGLGAGRPFFLGTTRGCWQGRLIATLAPGVNAHDAEGELGAVHPAVQRWRAMELVHGDIEPTGLPEVQSVRP